MILFLFSFVSCNKLLGIDFGSQYLKFGIADLETGEYLTENLNHVYGYPGAFAIKTPNDSDAPLTNETLDGISIKYAKSALKYLKKHPHNGAEYILNAVTRDDPEFRTSTVVKPTTLFTLFFAHILTQIEHKIDGMYVSFPSFFTPSMRQDAINGLRYFNTRIKGITDDASALSVLYADTYLNRYLTKMRKVLFVDVGFSYTKLHLINFTYNGNSTIATLLATSWSEKCGGYAFAKALSRSARIPIHSAEKMLKDVQNDLEFAKDELSELNRIINETVETGGLVDEVQIIGGASRYDFVYQAVAEASKDAYNISRIVKRNHTAEEMEKEAKDEKAGSANSDQTSAEKLHKDEHGHAYSSGFILKTADETINLTLPKVLREFDPSIAIALGTVHQLLLNENRSMFNPTYMVRKPVASYYARCGLATEKICQRNAICKQPFFHNIKSCPDDTIEILIDKRHTPTGTQEVVTRLKMTNISNMVYDSDKGIRGMIRMHLPDATVDGIAWCNSTNECYPISYQDISFDKDDLIQQYDLFESITTRLTNPQDKKEYVDQIKTLFQKLEKAINSPEAAQSPYLTNNEFKDKFKKLKKVVESKDLAKLPLDKLMSFRDEIRTVLLNLGMKSTD